ncbi:MAG: DUF4153 domain-containing protein [Paludibacteraceae bacterium]
MTISKLSVLLTGKKLLSAISRFPITFALILTLAGFLFAQIYNDKSDYIDQRVWYFLPLSVVLSLAVYLFFEYKAKCLLKNIFSLLSVALWSWFAFSISTPISNAEFIRLALLAVSWCTALFFAPFVSGKNQLKFWDYLQETFFQLIMAFFFGGIFMAGLSLALFSLDQLFGIKILDTYYGYLAVVCFIIFSPFRFLSSLPKRGKQQEISVDNISSFIKILGLYILLPILGIYLLILYGYLGKIIFTWQLPNGWVSWLISILGIAGYLTLFLLSPLYSPYNFCKNQATDVVASKTANKKYSFTNFGRHFYRFFPLLLIPLAVLMFVGIMRRFSDYGITINRLLVLSLNLWLLGISTYLFLTRSKQIKWIFISFSAIAFLVAIGPWSVMHITKKTLVSELEQNLKEINWSVTQKNDTTTLKTKLLSLEKKKRTNEIINYLSDTYKRSILFPYYKNTLGKNATQTDFVRALGLKTDMETEQYFSTSTNIQNYEQDIFGYKTLINISKGGANNANEIKIGNNYHGVFNNDVLKIVNPKTKRQITISLNKLIRNIENKGNKTLGIDDLIIQDNDYKLIIKNIEGIKDRNNLIHINYFEAIMLLK